MDLFPGTQLGIGPAIEDGFYYDFQLHRPLTPDDLAAIEARMAAARRRRPPVRPRASCRRTRAGPFFVERGQPFKVEILDDLAAKAEAPTATPMPPTTVLRARPVHRPVQGPHVASTGKIGPFKLLAVAGAYWRGDEKRPMLQRIYGTVWATQEELDQYLWRREEAKKRDHRRLGVQLDLFSFHDVSPGLGVLAPQGPADLAHARRRRCASSRSGAATRRSARRSSSTRSCGSSRATGTCTTRTCSGSSPRARRSASSR